MRLLSICLLFALLAISTFAAPLDFDDSISPESSPPVRAKRQWGYGGGWGRPGWGGGGWGRPGWGGGGWGRPGWGGGGWGRPGWGGGWG